MDVLFLSSASHNLFCFYFYLVKGLPFPVTASTSTNSSASLLKSDSSDKKAGTGSNSQKKTSVAEPTKHTCGIAHIVTGWTNIQGNDHVSVTLILPSGVNPHKNDHVHLQVSECGCWLNIKVKVDMALTDVYQCYHSYLTKLPHSHHPMALNYHGKVCAHKHIITEMVN